MKNKELKKRAGKIFEVYKHLAYSLTLDNSKPKDIPNDRPWLAAADFSINAAALLRISESIDALTAELRRGKDPKQLYTVWAGFPKHPTPLRTFSSYESARAFLEDELENRPDCGISSFNFGNDLE